MISRSVSAAAAAKRPGNNNRQSVAITRIAKTARQCLAVRRTEFHAGLSKCYFAAVGSGTGLSASDAR